MDISARELVRYFVLSEMRSSTSILQKPNIQVGLFLEDVDSKVSFVVVDIYQVGSWLRRTLTLYHLIDKAIEV